MLAHRNELHPPEPCSPGAHDRLAEPDLISLGLTGGPRVQGLLASARLHDDFRRPAPSDGMTQRTDPRWRRDHEEDHRRPFHFARRRRGGAR
jgi:hypothetical protein